MALVYSTGAQVMLGDRVTYTDRHGQGDKFMADVVRLDEEQGRVQLHYRMGDRNVDSQWCAPSSLRLHRRAPVKPN